MASLYDMELQESNNFIHALMANGITPALKMMEEQFTQIAAMGDAGKELAADFGPDGEMGKNLSRMRSLKTDIEATMKQLGFTPTLAQQANEIFSKSPESLSVLNDADRNCINQYWIKKKSCIVVLLKKGYTHEELFS